MKESVISTCIVTVKVLDLMTEFAVKHPAATDRATAARLRRDNRAR